MRGHYEADPIEVARSLLEESAIKYASQCLLDRFGLEKEAAAQKLRQAAVAYAEATAPKKRVTPRATEKRVK